jgi:hypothetical protein
MTNLEAFLTAILSTEHSVFGFKLRPLTLFHFAMLEQFAPTSLTIAPSPRDLKIAACICASRDANEFRRNSKGWRAWRTNFYSYKKSLASFSNYMGDHLQFPETNSADKETNNPIPTSLTFASKLIKETGYDFDRVFYDMPLIQVYWLVMGLGYIEKGESPIVSDKERLAYAVLKEAGELTA